MRPITYVICSAGAGQRFKDKGINKAKPLILLQGKTMLERSLDSLDIQPEDQVIVIYQVADRVEQFYPAMVNVQWLGINQKTKGQLSTFMLAEKLIKNEDIVIYNCDTFFKSAPLRSLIECAEYDGIIPCSQEKGTSWSFCQVDQNLNILKVAEKERISEWASVGYYYFKNKATLLQFSQQEVNENKNQETYVAPIYNRYLSSGLKLKMLPVETFLPFGTVEQVQDYWNVSTKELLEENS